VTVINRLSEMVPLAVPVYSKVAGSFGGIVFSRTIFRWHEERCHAEEGKQGQP